MGYNYGIDVSKYQGTIDWSKVKASGIKFAILKCTKKDNTVEESFVRNYLGASSAGLEIGVYRYVYAKNTDEAIKEANAVVSALSGKKMPAGIWLDMEDASIKALGKNKLTEIIMAETFIFRLHGYVVGIYCNKDWYQNVLDHKTLEDDSHMFPFWIARYPLNDDGKIKEGLNPALIGNRIVAWQYSSKGSVSGVTGNVDRDICYWDLKDTMSLYKMACDKIK